MLKQSPFDKLTPFDNESGDLNVVIETPKGSRNKYSYDETLGLFVMDGLPSRSGIRSRLISVLSRKLSVVTAIRWMFCF